MPIGRPLPIILAATAALALAACGDEAPPPPPGAPNVLMIVWDTVRADRLSAYDPNLDTTPWLARFAGDAVLYERAIAPGIWTLPTHASLFTGLPVSAHGAIGRHEWLDNRFRTLAEILRDAGYDTYSFSSNPYVSETTNLVQGFGKAEYSWEDPWFERCRAATEAKLIPEDASTEISPGRKREAAGGDDLAARRTYKDCGPVTKRALLEWIDSRPEKRPFFAFLNYMEAHVPRVPTEEARRRIAGPEAIRESFRIDQTAMRLFLHMFGVDLFGERELDRIREVYDASLVDLDADTGGLIEALEKRGILDDTLVVITSDHGENLGDHGLFDHKYCVYDTLVRVPLVVRYPRRFAPGRVNEPVSLLDLFPTILDAAGLPASGDVTASPLPAAGPGHQPEPVVSEMVAPVLAALNRAMKLHPEIERERWERSMRSVEHDGFKLIAASDGSRALYNIRRDPGELFDLSSDYPKRVEGLEAILGAWYASFEPYDLENAPDEQPEEGFVGRMLDQLKGLGYVGQ